MKSGKLFLMLALPLLIFCCAPKLQADDWAIMRPVEKLSRGIANVGFSVLEIPMKWMDVKRDQGGIAGITYGTLRGVSFMLARIGVGVVDILTFPFPLPDCPEDPKDYGWGYGPIIRPAWVVDVEHDWGNFVYENEDVVRSNY